MEHARHHASTVDLLMQGEFGWDPEDQGFQGMSFMGFEIGFTGFPVPSTAALLKLFGKHSPNNAPEQSPKT